LTIIQTTTTASGIDQMRDESKEYPYEPMTATEVRLECLHTTSSTWIEDDAMMMNDDVEVGTTRSTREKQNDIDIIDR